MTEESEKEDLIVEEIIRKYDEMFKNRYTDDDPGYVAAKQKASPAPPCVKNWYNKPKRNYDWTRDGNQGGRGQRGGGGHYGNHRGHRGYHQGYQDRNYGGRGQYHNHLDNRQQSYHRQSGYYGNQQRNRYQPY